MKSKKIYYIVIGIVLFAFSFYLGISYALQSFSSKTTNTISTGELRGQLVESGDTVLDNVYPGSKINKTIQVKNTGTTNALVRVKVIRLIGERDSSGNITSPENASPLGIKLNVINNANGNSMLWSNTNDINNWHYVIYNAKGNVYNGKPNVMAVNYSLYFYYMKVLKPGETTENLIDEIEMNTGISNLYSSFSVDVKFDVEMIQATSGAAKSIWNLSDAQISSIYGSEVLDDEKSYDDVDIIFNSSTEGFNIDSEEIDVFKNFKNLQPGMVINQTINLKNNYTGTSAQTFYLRAEPINNDDERVVKLLKEYAIITIKDESGNILYSGPVWNEEDNSYMINDITLASVSSNSSKKIYVTLALDSSMTNEYQKLAGSVNWNLITNFDDSKVIVRYYLWDKVKDKATNIQVSDSDELIGLVGTNYVTRSKDLGSKYVLNSTPSNANGVYENGIVYVDYYYILNSGNVTEPVLKINTDTEIISSKDQIIDYNISYNTSISSYYGDATYKIVAQLPSYVTCVNTDAGYYDSVNNTITWSVNLNDINNISNGKFDINFSKNISVKIKDNININDVDSMTVSVDGTLELLQTGEKKNSSALSTVKCDVAEEATITVNHYYKDSSGEKTETETINTFVGNQYETSSLSKLTSIGYKVIRIDGKAKGVVSSKNMVVNYHYKLINSDNPPTGDTIAIICTIFIISVIVCILSMVYLVYSGKFKKK